MASKKTARALTSFFLHLSQMEKAGLPLMQSLDAAAQDEEIPGLAKKWRNMSAFLRGGGKLYEAMGLYPHLFDDAVRGLVAAGEESGKLARVLERCKDYYEQVENHSRQMRRATLQPKIAAVVIAGMALVKRHSLFPKLAVGVLAAVFAVTWGRRYVPGVRRLTDHLFLMSGPGARFIRQYSYARFADALGMAYMAGIPLRRGLEIAVGVVPNLVLRDDLAAAIPRVQAGASLAEAFVKCRYADRMSVVMLKAGENSGNLSQTLAHVAEYYNKQTDDALTALQQTLGPLLTILLGLALAKSL
ncbi:MAG: hypothetical protein GC185_08820 [Alphaproteobacteria bacterium]|nr:hypothetical protein [Alphaproteobacteria bacterium]